MSVCLLELKDPEFDTVEVWAPDFDKRNFWLCDEESDNRIDLSIEQANALRDFLNKELPL